MPSLSRPSTSGAVFPEASSSSSRAGGAAEVPPASPGPLPDAQLLRRAMQLSQSAGALPRESARGGGNGGSRFVGPLPMTRLVLGFTPAPSPHMKKLYSVDERLLAIEAAAAGPDAARTSSPAPRREEEHSKSGSRDGSFRRPRWANEFSMGIGTY